MDDSNRGLIIGLVVVLLAIAALLFFMGDRDGTEEEAADTEETQEDEGLFDVADSRQIEMEEQNDSGESGTVLLEDLGDGRTRVTLDISSEQEGPQPAHIHTGTCDDLGGIEYPLQNVNEGFSETTVNVSMQELLDGTFAVNVHLSPQEIETTTSCGDIA